MPRDQSSNSNFTEAAVPQFFLKVTHRVKRWYNSFLKEYDIHRILHGLKYSPKLRQTKKELLKNQEKQITNLSLKQPMKGQFIYSNLVFKKVFKIELSLWYLWKVWAAENRMFEKLALSWLPSQQTFRLIEYYSNI